MRRIIGALLIVFGGVAFGQAPRPPIDLLSKMRDVQITSLADGDGLLWNAAASKWKNGPAGGGATALSGLSDVTISSPSLNQGLIYDGSKWINGSLTIDSISDGVHNLFFDLTGLSADRTFAVPNSNFTGIVPNVVGTASVGTPAVPMFALGVNTDGTIAYGYQQSSTQTAIAAQKDNWNLPAGTGFFQRWSSSSGTQNVTGLSVSQTDGEWFVITNTANTIVLKHDVTSTAANRFSCSTGADVTLGANEKAFVEYDSTISRWRVTPLKTASTSTPGGSNTQVQYNNSSAFGGITSMTTDGTIVTQLTGADFLFADPTDPTKKAQIDTSAITTGTTRTFKIANSAQSVSVVPDAGASNNFLTSVSTGGVIGKSQPAFSNLSGSATDGQIPDNITLSQNSVTDYFAFTAIAAPTTPGVGVGRVYVDSTSKNLAVKDDAGVVKHGIQTDTGASNNFLTAVSDAGLISKAQPSFSNLSGTVDLGGAQASGTLAAGRFPALTGDVTTSAGSLTTTLANIPDLTAQAGSILATNIAAPASPAAGKTKIYVDSTSKNVAAKNDAGTVNHGIQSRTATGSNWIRSIADDGTTAISQPAQGDITGLTTADSPQFTAINVGNASDTTVDRVSAGVIEVEGVTIPTISSTNTLTNKRVNPRETNANAPSSPITINSDTTDVETITALGAALTLNAPSGTPVQGQKLLVRFKDDGTARALTWTTGSAGAFRASSDLALPTTTTLSKTLYCMFIYNSTDSRWDFMAKLDNF